jgi:hypothetical protein
MGHRPSGRRHAERRGGAEPAGTPVLNPSHNQRLIHQPASYSDFTYATCTYFGLPDELVDGTD